MYWCLYYKSGLLKLVAAYDQNNRHIPFKMYLVFDSIWEQNLQVLSFSGTFGFEYVPVSIWSGRLLLLNLASTRRRLLSIFNLTYISGIKRVLYSLNARSLLPFSWPKWLNSFAIHESWYICKRFCFTQFILHLIERPPWFASSFKLISCNICFSPTFQGLPM